jgi:lactate permease
MIGLGFKPFHAAALNLIANTSPVAWGAIGTPVHTLAAVSGLPESDLSAMIGRILPITGIIVPFWLVRAMVGWAETLEVLPAILVVGVSFSLTQYFWSNHVDSNLVDIAGGVVSLIATIAFLKFWQPKRVWRFDDERVAAPVGQPRGNPASAGKHTGGEILKAWLPFAILSLFVFLWGLPAVKSAINRATTPVWSRTSAHSSWLQTSCCGRWPVNVTSAPIPSCPAWRSNPARSGPSPTMRAANGTPAACSAA